MMGWGFMHDGGWGFWIAGLLGTLLWVGLIVLIVIVAARLLRGPRGPMGQWYGQSPTGPGASPDSPEEILHRRLATGEIDTEEYEKRLAALRANRPGS